MLASPFAFYRGAAAIMAADLAHTPRTGINAQLCGDAHLSNIGGYAAPDRELVFDLNDFDETLPGPWEWDVKRLMASLAIAGREGGFEDRDRAAVVRSAAAAYRDAMREFAAMGSLQVNYSRMTVTDVRARWGDAADKKTRRAFERNVEKSMTKDSARAAAKLTHNDGGSPRIASDPPLVVPISELLGPHDAHAFEEMVEHTLRSYRSSLSTGRRHLLERYRFVDAARKVVGVGSVGTRAWVVLMLGIVDDEPLMLQLKEANPSVLADFAGRSRYENQGQRVVVGQQTLAGGVGHLPRLHPDHGHRRGGTRLLHPAAVGLEDVHRRGSAESRDDAHLRPAVRVDPRAGTRCLGRPGGHRGLPRSG